MFKNNKIKYSVDKYVAIVDKRDNASINPALSSGMSGEPFDSIPGSNLQPTLPTPYITKLYDHLR